MEKNSHHTAETKERIRIGVTKYKAKYCREIREHFEDIDWDARGRFVREPSFLRFADEIGVTTKTIENWRRAHPEFEEACAECERRRDQLLIDAALANKVNPRIAQLLLSSRGNLTPRVETQVAAAQGVKLTIEKTYEESENQDVGVPDQAV